MATDAMFDKDVMQALFDDERVAKAMKQLILLEDSLNASFYDAKVPVKAMVLGVATQSSVLFDGPPGVAKSALVRRLSELCDVLNPKEGDHDTRGRRVLQRGDYFEYLLSTFTEPTELFGSYSLEGLGGEDGRLKRHDNGMVHRCRVVFLDEVFNASSAVLNSLLALMNERLFHDRGEIVEADLKVFFGATNEVLPPRDPRNRAVYDRFVYRCRIDNVEAVPESLMGLVKSAWQGGQDTVPRLRTLLDDVEIAYRDVFLPVRPNLWNGTSIGGELRSLNYLIDHAASKDLGRFSNRRIVQLCEGIAIERLMRAFREGSLGDASLSVDDFSVLWMFFLDRTEPLDVATVKEFESVFKNLNASKGKAA